MIEKRYIMINEWKEILVDCMDQHLAKIIISGPRKKDRNPSGAAEGAVGVSGKCLYGKTGAAL